MTRKEAWDELKETIAEMRDNDGTGTQQETCKFLINIIDVLEKQITDKCIPEPYVHDINVGKMPIKAIKQEPCEDCISRQSAVNAMLKIEQDDIDKYGCSIPEGFDSNPAIQALNDLSPVTPYKAESEEEK